jgi:hypothetical protein
MLVRNYEYMTLTARPAKSRAQHDSTTSAPTILDIPCALNKKSDKMFGNCEKYTRQFRPGFCIIQSSFSVMWNENDAMWRLTTFICMSTDYIQSKSCHAHRSSRYITCTHYIRNTQSTHPHEDGDVKITRLRRHVSHYKVIWDARPCF